MKVLSLIFLLSSIIVLVFFIGCRQNTPKTQAEIPGIYHYSEGEGSPVIVIHGGPGLGSAYLEQHLDELKADHEVIFFDQRNSGRSPMNSDTSLIRLTQFIIDIESLRKHYGHQKIALLGHSWGGLIAMNYALTYPDQLSHLILMNSNTANSELNNQANTKLANRFSADDLEARTRVMRSEAFINQNPKAYEELMEIGFSYQFSDRNKITQLKLSLPDDFGKKSELLANLYQDIADYDFTDRLSVIRAPTLLLYGLDDPLTPYALNSIGKMIPNATIKIIEDAGHFPFIEKNRETIEAINEFLK